MAHKARIGAMLQTTPFYSFLSEAMRPVCLLMKEPHSFLGFLLVDFSFGRISTKPQTTISWLMMTVHGYSLSPCRHETLLSSNHGIVLPLLPPWGTFRGFWWVRHRISLWLSEYHCCFNRCVLKIVWKGRSLRDYLELQAELDRTLTVLLTTSFGAV